MVSIRRHLQNLALGAVAVLAAMLALPDAVEFYQLSRGNYRTPWYSGSWFKQPFTNARLAMLPSREYWTMNAIGSERWLVRETHFSNVVFWTTLERVDATKGEPR